MAQKFGPHVERLHAVAGSRTGQMIAIAGWRDVVDAVDSRVTVFNAKDATTVMSAPVDGAVGALCFLADDLLVAGTDSGRLLGWDPGLEPTAALFDLEVHGGAIGALAADQSGTLLASAGEDGTVALYALGVKGGKPELIERGRSRKSSRPQRAIAIEAEGARLAAAGADGVIRVWGAANLSGAAEREMPCGEGGVGVLAFTGDGRIVAGCGDGSIRICYLDGAPDEENRSGDAAHTGAVHGLMFGPLLLDEAGHELPRRLFSVAEDGVLKAWQLDTKRKPRSVEIGAAPLRDLGWLAAPARAKSDRLGGTLIAVSDDRRITLVTLNERSEPASELQYVGSAFAQLEEDLSAKNDGVREEAIRRLGELAEDEARCLLEQALVNDRKTELRALAADELGRGGRRRARPALRTALDDAALQVARAALAALQRLEGEDGLAPLRSALVCRHDQLRMETVGLLPAMRAVSPLVPGLVAEALNDRAMEVRNAALDALYALAEPNSVQPVRTALDRGPADLRVAALLRLGFARQTQSKEGRGLVERALDDDDAGVRRTAFMIAVGAQPNLRRRLCQADPDLANAYAKILQHGPLSGDAVGEDLDTAALAVLFSMLTCKHADAALRGARALALLADTRASGHLLQLSRDEQADVRLQAVEALKVAAWAMPGDDRLAARLTGMIQDQEANVRSRAFEALQSLHEPDGPRGALALAGLALESSQADIRKRSLKILVGFGGAGKAPADPEMAEQARALLATAMDDEDQGVHSEAFKTLWSWYGGTQLPTLQQVMRARHADLRLKVVDLLDSENADWSTGLLLEMVGDSTPAVGLAAYKALTESSRQKQRAEVQRKRSEVHHAALESVRFEVRAAGCVGAGRWGDGKELRGQLVELVREDQPRVHLAAIEAIDRLLPDNGEGFDLAFSSIFYNLRVRAAELCGKRRDPRAIAPMQALLSIPETDVNRPADALRQRAACALADVGDPETLPYYVAMLEEADPLIREQGARGMAAACRPQRVQPLIDALVHDDLAVRSWVAEGLARLGDERAVPVLVGNLQHEHPPIRHGAILSLVALGEQGAAGLRQGLVDPDRAIQDLVFAVVVARDVAMARAGLAPDLLCTALAAARPEVRFSAARVLELRRDGSEIQAPLQELIGPRRPERASEMKDWPGEDERARLLSLLIDALASDHPARRYASARILSLRPQPKSFWREAKGLASANASDRPWAPFTSWESEKLQPSKRGWVRALFGGRPVPRTDSATERVLTVVRFVGGSEHRSAPSLEPERDPADLIRLAFGTYAGLIRQAPAQGESDETQRVRRDSIERVSALAGEDAVGRDAVLPVLQRALNDPHNLVRKAAAGALRGLYEEGSLEPLALALDSAAADVGRLAVDTLVAAAQEGDPAARVLALDAINAPAEQVRAYALGAVTRLFDKSSVEPWLLALGSRYPDVRLAVVDSLADLEDERVVQALGRAMESDHEDLCLKAATAVARRGDRRCVDVLASFLRSEDSANNVAARRALVALAHARIDPGGLDRARAAAAGAIAARIEDDPDRTADRAALIDDLARIGHPAAAETLLQLLEDEQDSIRRRALEALISIAVRTDAGPQVLVDGTRRERYLEDRLLPYLQAAASSKDAALRQRVVAVLRDVDTADGGELLARLIDDREPEVRVAACRAAAFRAEHVAGVNLDSLRGALRGGRRELVLPAASGLATHRRPEAFQALMLVLKAGEDAEREQAVVALGTLGDRRALEELALLVDPTAELSDEDRALAPAAGEALGRLLPHLEKDEERIRVRETLEQLVRQGSSPVRLRGMAGLRYSGDERSRSLLESIASDRSEDPTIRRRAINELGLLVDPASEPVLAEILDDEDSTLRKGALEALVRAFPDDRTRTSLLALGSRHSDMSRPAASFLARRGESALLVRRLPEIGDRSVRQRLRQGLIRRGACPTKELHELLIGDEAFAREEAAWLAGAAGRAELASPVGQAVEIAAIQWQKAHDELATAARLKELTQAWNAALWAAGRLAVDVRAGVVKALAQQSIPSSVQLALLRYLDRSATQEEISALEPLLSSVYPEVRASASTILARLAPERAAAYLAALSVPDVSAVSSLAAAAVEKEGAKLLSSSGGRQLVMSIWLSGGDRAPLVSVATTAGDEEVRLSAIAALGRIGGEDAGQALTRILANKQEADAVRAATFRALRRVQRTSVART